MARVEFALAGAIVVVACIAFSPITAAMVARMSPVDATRRLKTPPAWGWKQVLPVFGLLLLAFTPFQARSGEKPVLTPQDLEFTILIMGALAALAAILAMGSGPGSRRALGLRWKGNGRALGVGVLAFFVTLPGILGLMQMTPWVLSRMGLAFEDPGFAELFASVDGVRLAGLLILATFIGPFFEELLFRGFLQPVLIARLGPVWGIALCSAFFALLHDTSFLPIFGLSILLGGLAYRTRRLIAPVGVHALHNALQLSQLFVDAPEDVSSGLFRMV